MRESRRYRVGIDVGGRSVGFCAVAVDEDDNPIELLSSMVLVHDGGLDPDGQKTATTRLAAAGVARRMRRLVRRRRARLTKLDDLLEELGWLSEEVSPSTDPYFSWEARARLATERIEDIAERNHYLVTAMRHIARHRGWRSPYTKASSLLVPAPPSEQLLAFKDRVEQEVGRELREGLTPAQIVCELGLSPATKLRGPEGLLGGKLMQTDNAHEIQIIGEIQGLEPDVIRSLILSVFQAESPKGAQLGRVGKDPLPGQGNLPRASKAEFAFQDFRIVALLANLRIAEEGGQRSLDVTERRALLDYLSGAAPGHPPTWEDVAEQLGIPRERLRGTATPTADGDRSPTRPPVNVTHLTVLESKHKPLIGWWKAANRAEREAMAKLLGNSVADTDTSNEAEVSATDFLESLDDEDFAALDSVNMPAGRAAYSAESLERLTAVMLEEGLDLHHARKREFGVDDSWRPPAAPIGEQTGNPAVDRVLKAVARWLGAAERQWGPPQVVNIEHVREGFVSERKAREMDAEMRRRAEVNNKVVQEIHSQLGSYGKVSRTDIYRYRAFTRQNGQCLYCGAPLSFKNFEMDHIVARAGVGATNQLHNLAAVCIRCNRSKSKQVFSCWAAECGIEGVSVNEAIGRVRTWVRDPQFAPRQWSIFKREVIGRLKRTTLDPEFDGRSMESIAWMANELRHRIEQHWRDEGVSVGVFRGQLTAEARRASGFEGRIHFIGGAGKTRIDRRHHAMDAACMAMMRQGVAQILAQRVNLRDEQRIAGEAEMWKEWTGRTDGSRILWQRWVSQMRRLAELFNEAVEQDRIPVMESLRLRLSNGAAHKDTVQKLVHKTLESEFSGKEIDRASTPALWTALSRLPGFDLEKGLAADPSRHIVVNGTHYGPKDRVALFQGNNASILVRGGSVAVGDAIHHGRIYRFEDRRGKPTFGMVRVFAQDLLRYRADDLVHVQLPPQSLTRRDADMKVRRAVLAGEAEYLGWLVPGDEILVIPPEKPGTAAIDHFLAEYPSALRWRVSGYFAPSKLRLRPRMVAGEGLPDDASKPVADIAQGQGWLPAVNVLFGAWSPVVIRRDALGRVRLDARGSGLPTTWTAM